MKERAKFNSSNMSPLAEQNNARYIQRRSALAIFEAKKNARKAIGAALIKGAVIGPYSSLKIKKGMQLRV